MLQWIINHPNYIDRKQIISMTMLEDNTNILDWFAERSDHQTTFRYDAEIMIELAKRSCFDRILQWFVYHPAIEFKCTHKK